MDEALTFLNLLFEYKPDGTYVLIWTAQDKKSRWFDDLGQAARYAVARSEGHDVYFGVALAGERYGEYERLKCGAREPVGVYGMWADIDIAGANHNDQKRYPVTLEDALLLAHDTGLRPTVVVHSGGGIHAHYVLKEPRMLETPEEVQEARVLAWQWKETIKKRARARGWDIDSVSDLERVLRVPGTLNHKNPQQLRPVRML